MASDPFREAVDATERLKAAQAKLTERLHGKPWDDEKTLEEWQRKEQPEYDELERAIATYHEAGVRLVDHWKAVRP